MQPYADWEIIEDKDRGSFKYFIMKVKVISGDYTYRGFLSTGEWIENNDLNALRMSIYVTANQNR